MDQQAARQIKQEPSSEGKHQTVNIVIFSRRVCECVFYSTSYVAPTQHTLSSHSLLLSIPAATS